MCLLNYICTLFHLFFLFHAIDVSIFSIISFFLLCCPSFIRLMLSHSSFFLFIHSCILSSFSFFFPPFFRLFRAFLCFLLFSYLIYPIFSFLHSFLLCVLRSLFPSLSLFFALCFLFLLFFHSCILLFLSSFFFRLSLAFGLCFFFFFFLFLHSCILPFFFPSLSFLCFCCGLSRV